MKNKTIIQKLQSMGEELSIIAVHIDGDRLEIEIPYHGYPHGLTARIKL